MAVDREYRIKIVTVGDPSGATATGNAIDDLGKKTAKAGESAKTAAKEGMDKFELSGREARLMIDRLGPGVEGLGHLLTGLTSPLTLVGFGLIVAKNLLDEYNKTLDETAAKNAQASFADVLKVLRDGTNAAKESLAEFHFEMQQSANETERLNTALENNLRLMHSEAAAGAQHGRDMGETDIQQAYRAEQDHAAELAARSRALETAKVRQPDLINAADAADQKAAEEKSKEDVANATLVRENPRQEELRKKMLDTANKAAEAHRLVRVNSGEEPAQWGDTLKNTMLSIGGMRQNIAHRDSAAALAQSAYEQNEKAIADANKTLAQTSTAKDKAKEAHKEANENKTFIETQGPKIDSDRDNFAINDASAKRNALDKTSIGGGYTGADVERAAGLEQTKAMHGRMSQADAQWLAAFEKFAADHGVVMDRLLALMRVITGTQTTLQQKITDLDIIVRQLFQRSNSGLSSNSQTT